MVAVRRVFTELAPLNGFMARIPGKKVSEESCMEIPVGQVRSGTVRSRGD